MIVLIPDHCLSIYLVGNELRIDCQSNINYSGIRLPVFESLTKLMLIGRQEPRDLS